MLQQLLNFSLNAEVEKQNLPVSFIVEKGVIKFAAQFIGVSPEGLEKSLCTKTTLTRGETIVSPLSASQARDVCDAFVKGIYGRMFIWIIAKINQVIFKPKVSVGKQSFLATFESVADIFARSPLKLPGPESIPSS